MTEVEIPRKLKFLFEPHPYKCLYGGRDGCKSWSVAQALLILGTQRPLRILCGRETMDSIRESVHQLLSDQIARLGLDEFYVTLQSEIRGKNGTEFVFAGLRKQTVSSLKSYEAIDICWIEEASVVSRRSLTILLPTIRKPGSEIWFSLNPDLETDAVYHDFVLNPPPGCVTVKVGYQDNKWLSEESKQKIATLRERDADTFHHVYEGATRSTVEGAIYKQEIMASERDGRIRSVPFDPTMPVDTFWDLGFADRVSIWAAQRTPFEIRILRYFEGDHQAIDYYLREMQTWGYVFGTCFLPWDGGTRSLGTGKSIEELMRLKGFNVRVNRQLSVADGINATRTIFPQLYFDANLCADGLQYLRRYQWGPATALGVPRSQPLHDDASHACLSGDAQIRTYSGMMPIWAIGVGDMVWTPCGFSKVLCAGPVKKAELIELRFSNGSRLCCTKEHKIFTNRGLICADALRTSDRIQSGEEWNSVLNSWISTVTGLGYRAATTGRIVGVSRGHQTYIEPFGSTLMGQFQKAWMFITRLDWKTSFPILSFSNPRSTTACMPLSGIEMVHCAPLQRSHLSVRRNGIGQPKEVNGIGSTEARHGTASNGFRFLVKTAASYLIRLFQHAPNGAPSLVSMKPAIGRPADRGWVYDLTVENHACYQANGLLVSNSDALRTLAVGIREPERKRQEESQQYAQYGSSSWMA